MKTDVPADAYLAQERPRDAAGSFIFKSGRRETKENGEDTHEAGHKMSVTYKLSIQLAKFRTSYQAYFSMYFL